MNKVFEEDSSLRKSIWLRESGPSYIEGPFRWAHAAGPMAKQFLNDYNVEGVNAKSTACYELAKRLRAAGVPVQGFGIQGHLTVQYGFPGQVAENLARFEELGMRTAFTEVDVRVILPVEAEKPSAQAAYFRGLVDACVQARRCTSFTVWGFTDKYSWVPGVFGGRVVVVRNKPIQNWRQQFTKSLPAERVQCGGRADRTDTFDFLIALMSYGESTVKRGSLSGTSKSRSFFPEMDGTRHE